MKYIQIILLLLISCQLNLKAQKASKEFGKVGRYAMEYKNTTGEKDTEAVVLFDKGKSYFTITDRGFEIIYERTTRIKILKEAGIKWAEISIPFYQEGNIYEQIYDLKAYTYNVDNNKLSKTELKTNTCHVEKINNSWHSKKFAMPEVKVGSIIDYKYKIRSEYLYNLRDWTFQWKIPVEYSEYTILLTPFYSYQWILQGADKFDAFSERICTNLDRTFSTLKFHDKESKFIMKNIPAFKDESYITSMNDYVMKLDFQLCRITHTSGVSRDIGTTWEKLIKDFLKNKNFGKFIKKSNKKAKKILDIEQIKKKTEKERFNYIVDYVKNNYSWDGHCRRYASKSVNEFIKDKKGNATDLNLFTIGLLRSVGIDAQAILSSTRGNGMIYKKYPFHHYFNNVVIIANVDGQLILTDSTEPLISNYRLPVVCLNDKGLIISKGKVEWVDLKSKHPTETRTKLTLDINDKNIKIDVDKISNEYSALFYKKKCGCNKEDLIKDIRDEGYTPIDSTIIIQENAKIKNIYKYKFKANADLMSIKNKIYIKPFLENTISENPFTQKIRTYPIDMVYPEKRTFTSIINIPEGYKIDFRPTDLKINNIIIDLRYHVYVDKNKLKVNFNYYFKKSIYSSKNYNIIKYYFKQIIKKGNEKIVFSKI